MYRHPRRINLSLTTILVSIALASGSAFAQKQGSSFTETEEEYQTRTKWWQDARFGMFIHWGQGCLFKNGSGGELSWARPGKNRPLDRVSACTPTATTTCASLSPTYDTNYRHWGDPDPQYSWCDISKYDPDSIVRLAKRAGQRYIVMIAKHHEGFAMWNTKMIAHPAVLKGTPWAEKPYSISSSPWGGDVIGLMAEACEKYDMPFGVYFSPRDWYNPTYGVGDNAEFEKFMLAQITELLTNYGGIDIIWWDGFGKPRTGGTGRANCEKYWNYQKVLDSVYTLNPKIISNCRCVYFFDKSNDNGIGDFNVMEGGKVYNGKRLWEAVYRSGPAWGWSKIGGYKTGAQTLDILVSVACQDGNFMPNLDPKPDGSIPQQELDQLAYTGNWLEKYGESIYKTRKGPIKTVFNSKKAFQYGSTCKDSTMYVHLAKWNGSITLPAISQKIVANSAKRLQGGTVDVTQSADNKITIKLTGGTTKADDIDVIAIKMQELLHDTTSYYDPDFDPHTTPVSNPLKTINRTTLSTPNTFTVMGDRIVLKGNMAGKTTQAALYTLSGKLVRKALIRNGQASLLRDFGARQGAYILKIQ